MPCAWAHPLLTVLPCRPAVEQFTERNFGLPTSVMSGRHRALLAELQRLLAPAKLPAVAGHLLEHMQRGIKGMQRQPGQEVGCREVDWCGSTCWIACRRALRQQNAAKAWVAGGPGAVCSRTAGGSGQSRHSLPPAEVWCIKALHARLAEVVGCPHKAAA